MADQHTTLQPDPQPDSGSRDPRREPSPPSDHVRVVDRRWWARANSGTDAGEPSSDKPAYVQELEQRLAAKDEELRATIAKYREASQEFEQARLRARRDAAKDVERGTRAILTGLLDVMDNLDRAIDAARQAGTTGPLLQGVEMVHGQFLSALGGFGVKPFDAMGASFDPRVHEAVTTVPVTGSAQDGVVVGVIRVGYTIGDGVLRPAVVAVTRRTTERAPS